jgi:hypothetical protein
VTGARTAGVTDQGERHDEAGEYGERALDELADPEVAGRPGARPARTPRITT